MPRVATACLLLLLVACGGGTGDVDRTIRLRVAGDDRTFDLFVPGGLTAPAPLLVVFHGFTSNPGEIRRQSGFDDLARRHGFAVAYPRALGLVPAWRADPSQGDADLAFFAALVDATSEVVAVDRSAVMVAGFSNGGGMAVRLGCELPEAVAAVAAVAAALRPPACSPDAEVPLLVFHGTEDAIVPYAGSPGYLAGVEEWVSAWAAAAGCRLTAPIAVTRDVTRRSGEACAAPVVLYSITAGGHGWPGGGWAPARLQSTDSIDASRLIAEFFSAVMAS